MIHYSQCPVCLSGSVKEVFSSKDHTVSRQLFSVWQCNECTARFTQDVPGQESIGPYYASDAYISHSDTKEGLVNRLYHLVRKQTLGAKRNLIISETGKRTGTLLDVGCGTGLFLNSMKLAGWKLTGLEPDEYARSKASSLLREQVLPTSALFNLSEGSFDAITMWHVLEHVHQLHEYVSRLAKLLAINGKLIIAVPNYTSYDAGHFRENWAAYDVPRHLYHFSPASMKKLMKMHGLVVKRTKPMWFDSFYVSMLSEKYKTGRNNFISACWTGLVSNAITMVNREKCSSVIYIITKA